MSSDTFRTYTVSTPRGRIRFSSCVNVVTSLFDAFSTHFLSLTYTHTLSLSPFSFYIHLYCICLSVNNVVIVCFTSRKACQSYTMFVLRNKCLGVRQRLRLGRANIGKISLKFATISFLCD